MQKVAVNYTGWIACFKKAVGYVGGRVTTSSVTSWGLSGHQARQQVAHSQGPVLVAGLSLNK
jgi:hypothetical protein